MSAVEDRLKDLGMTVPDVAKPVAAYVPALQDHHAENDVYRLLEYCGRRNPFDAVVRL